MAGDIKTNERSIITLSSGSQASLTNNSAGALTGADLDARAAGGTGNAEGDFLCRFELICQWSTVTGITAGSPIAELYLVPKLDGTNLPDVDTTAGSSRLPSAAFACLFDATRAPTTSTDTRFVSPIVELFPALYTAYLLNRSGQTISANWTCKVVPAQAQYT